ncbi:hypothetical protein DICPUDRAFT_77595 [Dictyostelium purpureum]|uniref:ADP-ribosylation factor n=1 Tax=Dictyostelium purpureum TaxID=5786 RepID=F0ZH34_DICPU|nr:uncharacterized protein DICPUDRAFT_77595 [Dictyostelium purpureum]EGC36782.1 hypothetical protein DICPUDRAFT_77595 [Dictyostelium purpureum]|eukprot:XP_003286728.1 hypothetical protein DICPUDRAFT_77595 [Dictyostelium purpureum]
MGVLFSTNKRFRFLILGLDGVGKKKILYRIKHNQDYPTLPSKGIFIEETQFNIHSGIQYDLYMMVFCGQCKIREFWPNTYKNMNADALIFVIDATDKCRIEETKEEIHILNNNEDFKNDPFLILVNKTDVPLSMKSIELVKVLGLENLSKKRKWNIIDTNALVDIKLGGIDKGLIWLLNTLTYDH